MSGIDLSRPPGSDEEFIAPCEIPAGESGCSYTSTTGGVPTTGGLLSVDRPQPAPPVVVSVGGATLDVTVREGIRISSNDLRRQGPNAPRHARTRATSGDEWVNVRAISQAGEGALASHALGVSQGTQLVAQDFGFRMPLASTPETLTVEIDRSALGSLTSESLSAVVCGMGAAGNYVLVLRQYEYSSIGVINAATGDEVNATGGAWNSLIGADDEGNVYVLNGGVVSKYGPDLIQIW